MNLTIGKAPAFGIEEYKAPKLIGIEKTTKTFQGSKARLKNFVEDEIKAKSGVPPPNTYSVKKKWEFLDNQKRGGFLKKTR